MARDQEGTEDARRPPLPHMLSVPLVIFLVCWGQMTHGKPTVSGDGPHYLMVTQSLVADGDLDPANNYQANEGRAFGADGLTPGLFLRRAPSGRMLPVHDIGLSLLVLPVYRIASSIAPHVPSGLLAQFRMPPGLFVYSVVCLFMLLLTSAGWWLVARTLADYVPVGRARLLVLFIALSPPLIANGSAVFPEVPALLVVSLVLAQVFGRRRLPLWLVMLAIGCLPWLHRKYFLLALALVLLPLLKHRVRGRRSWAMIALAVTPMAALVAWTYATWGSFGGPLTLERVPLSWATFGNGSLGMFFDREFGIVPWAPAALLLPLAWALAGTDGLLLLIPAVLLYAPAASHDLWWGGWGPVGRFLVPAAPLAALVFGFVQRWPSPRWLTGILVGLQVGLTAWVWQRPRLLWNFGDGHNRLLESLPFGRVWEAAWPSYMTDPRAWVLGLLWLAATAGATMLLVSRSRRVSSAGRF